MTFVSPLWLAMLLPWTSLVLWMLLSKPAGTAVPFLNLWRDADSAPQRTVKRHLTLPPFPILCVLLALLLAILGAAAPRITTVPYTEGPEITVIIDRGLSMTATGVREPRWKELVQTMRSPLQAIFGIGTTRLVLLPEANSIDADRISWAFHALNSEPAAVDTRSILPAIVSRELARPVELIFVLTDQQLPADPRLIVVPPMTDSQNVGIVTAGAAANGQVMVRLRNDSDQKTAHLEVGGAAQWVDLPPRGQERNYFVDVQKPQTKVPLELLQADQQSLDNHAALIQENPAPILEARGILPAEVRRVVDSYSRVRHTASGIGARVIVTSESPSADVQFVQLAPTTRPAESTAPSVEDHPIAHHIDWSKALTDASIAVPPAGNWRAIVSQAGAPLVAIREDRARQVWIGFSSPTWPRSTDFVMFWQNVLDWTGGGAPGYRVEGTPAVPMPQPGKPTWLSTLKALPRSQRAGLDLGAPLLLLAVGMMLLSLLCWVRRA